MNRKMFCVAMSKAAAAIVIRKVIRIEGARVTKTSAAPRRAGTVNTAQARERDSDINFSAFIGEGVGYTRMFWCNGDGLPDRGLGLRAMRNLTRRVWLRAIPFVLVLYELGS
jgi:hypothetical protein